MGKGRERIPLNDAEKHLRQRVVSEAGGENLASEEKLMKDIVPEQGRIELDAKNADVLRNSNSYKLLREMYDKKEISLAELKDIYQDSNTARFLEATFGGGEISAEGRILDNKIGLAVHALDTLDSAEEQGEAGLLEVRQSLSDAGIDEEIPNVAKPDELRAYAIAKLEKLRAQRTNFAASPGAERQAANVLISDIESHSVDRVTSLASGDVGNENKATQSKNSLEQEARHVLRLYDKKKLWSGTFKRARGAFLALGFSAQEIDGDRQALLGNLRGRLSEISASRKKNATAEQKQGEPREIAPITEQVREVDHPVFQALDNLYIQGMELSEMKRMFLGGKEKREYLVKEKFSGAPAELKKLLLSKDWHDKAEKYFARYIDEGYKPGAQFVSKLLFKQPGVTYEQLNASSKEEGEKQFIKVMHDKINDFVYSGRWRYNKQKKTFEVSDDADLDARVSLFLFREAGFSCTKDKEAKALPHGETKPGAVHVDIGYEWGASVKQDGAAILDTHQQWRAPIESSTAKITYRLMTEGGFIKENAITRQMVELTVADDNARLITDREQFEKSARTIRGLHRFFEADKLYEFVQQQWRSEYEMWKQTREVVAKWGDNPEIIPSEFETKAKALLKHYGSFTEDELNEANHRAWREKLGVVALVGDEDRKKASKSLGRFIYERLLDHQLSDKEIKDFGLEYGVENQSKTIENAKTLLFDKSQDQLIEEGRVVQTKNGLAVVNIEGIGKKLYGGHDAVIAAENGYAMYIAIEPHGRSIMLNLTDRKSDISNKFEKLLKKYPQLKAVRGALIIKPKDGKEIVDSDGKQVPFPQFVKEAMSAITDDDKFEAKGMVKELISRADPKTVKTVGLQVESASALSSENVSDVITSEVEPKEVTQIEQPTPPADLPVVEEVVNVPTSEVAPIEPVAEPIKEEVVAQDVSKSDKPLTKSIELATEEWIDETGIKFSRELSADEQRIKDEIDDTIRHRLAEKAHIALKDPRFADQNAQDFVDKFVERGMTRESIVSVRVRQYNEHKLPVVENALKGS